MTEFPGYSYIYGLFDPRTKECRYVGKSDDLDERLTQHLRSKKSTHCGRWIRSMLAAGVEPRMDALSIAFAHKGESWQDLERGWISSMRRGGHRLTNLTDGGEGAPKGSKIRPELLAKWSACKMGTKLSAETCDKIAASKRGKPRPDAMKEKIRQKLLGRKLTDAHRASISAAQAGKPWTPARRLADDRRLGRVQ